MRRIDGQGTVAASAERIGGAETGLASGVMERGAECRQDARIATRDCRERIGSSAPDSLTFGRETAGDRFRRVIGNSDRWIFDQCDESVDASLGRLRRERRDQRVGIDTSVHCAPAMSRTRLERSPDPRMKLLPPAYVLVTALDTAMRSWARPSSLASSSATPGEFAIKSPLSIARSIRFSAETESRASIWPSCATIRPERLNSDGSAARRSQWIDCKALPRWAA